MLKRTTAAAVAALALLGLTAAPAAASANDARNNLGIFPGYNETDDWLDVAALIGRQPAFVSQFLGRRSVSDMTSSSYGITRPGGIIDELLGKPRVVVTMPLGFGTANSDSSGGRAQIAENLQQTASGAWDGAYRLVAQRLIASGQGDAVIRLGHEFDGSWSPWSSNGNEEAFKSAFRHVVGVLRGQSRSFLIDWNGVRARFETYGPQAYPGDAYVDIMGLDYYNRDGGPWLGAVSRAFEFHLAFAKAHGKPVSYPEWGLSGSDNPRHIQDMHAWFSRLPGSGPGSLAYHSYFNNKEYSLDRYPKSKAMFKQLFD